MNLIKLELIKWKRTNMSLILGFIFVFTGIVSPFMTKYSNKIINYISNSNTKISFSKINWEILIQNYFKNSSQIILFISVYIICSMCLLPKNDAKKFFYLTRVPKERYIYLPKYFASIINLILSMILGGICSIYMTTSFYNDVNLSNIVTSLLMQIIGFSSIVSISIIISIMTRSSFFSATFTELLIIFSGIFNNIKFIKDYSPTLLINPTNFLVNGVKLNSLPKSFYSSVFLILITIIMLLTINFGKLFRR
ncbi:hypothetical protein [Apilactobacillus timberlakei]|uniref:ABC transporter permease n=1 Tax=Apilactobacillus timberlakei TaxID=2008380 RepID=A0ABY2YRA5_9LACO|nr:hypothetical protein [Apilactobacillus timberlakei]TPR12314.1 hypothetical protein DY048_07915 [Apilactobacillus timberlakei]TPR12917.1 hypothetical protein DY052_09020 [Apilactobacillus timberlakei]